MSKLKRKDYDIRFEKSITLSNKLRLVRLEDLCEAIPNWQVNKLFMFFNNLIKVTNSIEFNIVLNWSRFYLLVIIHTRLFSIVNQVKKVTFWLKVTNGKRQVLTINKLHLHRFTEWGTTKVRIQKKIRVIRRTWNRRDTGMLLLNAIFDTSHCPDT